MQGGRSHSLSKITALLCVVLGFVLAGGGGWLAVLGGSAFMQYAAWPYGHRWAALGAAARGIVALCGRCCGHTGLVRGRGGV